MKKILQRLAFAMSLTGATASVGLAAPFTPDSLLVAHVGDSSAVRSNADTAALLKNPTGTSNALQVTNASSVVLFEDFETGTKAAYAVASVILGSGEWTLSDALLGATNSDKPSGLKSARVRGGGFMAMNFDKPNGAGTVVVNATLYGSDTGASFGLEVSTDGGNTYTQVTGAPGTLTGTLAPYTFTVNRAGNVRFRISNTNTNTGTNPRVIIDDISVADYLPTSTRPAAATQLMLYPNPAQDVLTVKHSSSTLLGELAELLDLTGRVVRTERLPASGELSVRGLPTGLYLLRVAGLSRRVTVQ